MRCIRRRMKHAAPPRHRERGKHGGTTGKHREAPPGSTGKIQILNLVYVHCGTKLVLWP
jgi:hypothetical protein